ncbi:hypothetical protein B0T16DRAFT_449897 [Cercophora newfieldiana]|uniref:Uncharacterized protein n=1 Tax=Cercophora newfieldiana TaxID=92897 RepID=A0AA39XSR7_9PEZI|nr:hypothetical protein B0T16DRAFT_449897 [Cercophora newfieldiana]
MPSPSALPPGSQMRSWFLLHRATDSLRPSPSSIMIRLWKPGSDSGCNICWKARLRLLARAPSALKGTWTSIYTKTWQTSSKRCGDRLLAICPCVDARIVSEEIDKDGADPVLEQPEANDPAHDKEYRTTGHLSPMDYVPSSRTHTLAFILNRAIPNDSVARAQSVAPGRELPSGAYATSTIRRSPRSRDLFLAETPTPTTMSPRFLDHLELAIHTLPPIRRAITAPRNRFQYAHGAGAQDHDIPNAGAASRHSSPQRSPHRAVFWDPSSTLVSRSTFCDVSGMTAEVLERDFDYHTRRHVTGHSRVHDRHHSRLHDRHYLASVADSAANSGASTATANGKLQIEADEVNIRVQLEFDMYRARREAQTTATRYSDLERQKGAVESSLRDQKDLVNEIEASHCKYTQNTAAEVHTTTEPHKV